MAAALEVGTFKELILFLATAGIVVPLATKLRVSPVLGFIGAGILLGPLGLGRLVPQAPWLGAIVISNSEQVAHLAEFGVVFLLFTIGLELSWERLRTLRRLVFGLGVAQVVVSTAILAAVAMAFGLRPGQAALCAVALALSSTAIVMPLLAEQKRLNSPTGRTSFAILLFQDLAVAPVLFTVMAVNTAADGGVLRGLSFALAQAALALVVIVLVGRLAMRPLFHLVAQTRSSELFMAASFLVVVGAAAIAATSGLSMALGAFVAGLLLAETEYRRAIEAVVAPFKGLLLGIFFVSIGMGLDLGVLLEAPLQSLTGAVGLIVIKCAVVVALGVLFRLPLRVGLEAGLLLGGGGEFAFVLIGAAGAVGLIPAEIAQAVLVIATLTMVALPLVARLGRRLGCRVADRNAVIPPDLAPPADAANRVILAGYGRVGQLVADMLDRHAVPWLALDSNPAVVAAARAGARPVYFGDMTAPSILETAGLENARALVVTLDGVAAVQSLVESARQARPDLTIVARARDARHASQLYALGVNDAVPETIEASLQLSEAVLMDIGIAMGPVIASIHERRDEYRRTLQAKTVTAQQHGAAKPRSGEFRGRRTAGKRTV